MIEVVFKVYLQCGHRNHFKLPIPRIDEPIYCYGCADYQLVVKVEQPRVGDGGRGWRRKLSQPTT